MSKIALEPNASGTGTFTIASPNSNTSRTLTLPDTDGALLTEAGVLTATAGASFGGVGTYAYVVYWGGELYAGNTIAGSSIHPATISKSTDVTSVPASTVLFGSEESALSGTWRLMSSARYSGTRSYGILALRIS